MKDAIRKLALRNAVMYGGKADPKAVMASFMATKTKGDAKEILALVLQVIDEVNSLSPEEQKNEAKKLDVSVEKERKEERHGLRPLEGAVKGGVVTRAAPNPDGPIHLGNARAFVLSYLYARQYSGRFILRFDDTDPRTKRPLKDAYGWIIEDLQWLGAKPDIVIYSSDRMHTYYEKAYELVRLGKAYVCTCDPDEWRKLRNAMEACPCRSLGSEDAEKRWFGFLDKYREGEAVLRIVTDVRHKDPAVRDWPAMRIIENANHPRAGNEFRVWPLYNFASAIDDHELGVTHILRGQEHSVNTVKQKSVYDFFGWKPPSTTHHGRLSIKGIVLSKSKTNDGIARGFYTGFDDPRLGTIKAFRKRGFQPAAIVQMIHDIGANPNDISIDIRNLAAYNKKLLDFKANRYFFVSEPVRIKVEEAPQRPVRLPFHPEDEKRGFRTLITGHDFFIEKRDFENLREKEVRLKELFNIYLGKRCKYSGDAVKKETSKIHWVPVQDHVKFRVVMPDGKEMEGVAEKAVESLRADDVVQFERFGFVRIDSKGLAYFAHN